MAGHADGPAGGAGESDERPAPTLYDLIERFADDTLTRVRSEGGRIGERAGGVFTTALQELGVAMRRQLDELELRVAQLEHRIALLEQNADDAREPGPADPSDA